MLQEGNTTGTTDLTPSIGGKWVELLKEAMPTLTRVALLWNPNYHNEVTRDSTIIQSSRVVISARFP
jgi:ABC-type uncharacterized transport system substrate-binding protein